MEASEEIESTSRSAGCLARSIAARTSGTRLVTPVEVSLWTTITALRAWPLSAASRASPVAGYVLDRDAQSLRELLPEGGEMPGLEGEHAIARRERVDERRFPGAGAGGAIDRDRRLRAEDP